MNNDETKRKKRKHHHDNPLSQARGKQKRPEQIWFRRSNGGYHLFCQYYEGQPDGVVRVRGKTNEQSVAATISTVPPLAQGAGLSRAAKKRKKKRQGKTQQPPLQQHVDPSPEITQPPLHSVVEFPASHPIRLALEGLRKSGSSTAFVDYAFLQFVHCMTQPLPLSFRLRDSLLTLEQQQALTRQLSTWQPDILAPSTFHPSVYMGRRVVSKHGHGESRNKGAVMIVSKESVGMLAPDLQSFLVEHSQNGNLARQEIGSMLPVLALQSVGALTPSSSSSSSSLSSSQCRIGVLDMCASPGSKTLQALEYLPKRGRIVANDVNPSRIQTLREALERSGVPSTLLRRVTYTCQDGTQLQLPRFSSNNNNNSSKSSNNNQNNLEISWKAIVCDVPCSGDGTCRKDKHILPMWKPNTGNELHTTQLRLLLRALHILLEDGIVCYSTCSLNPVEDEAVVAAALETFRNHHGDLQVELVRLSQEDFLPGLVRRPGVFSWKVATWSEGEKKEKDDEDDDDGRGEMGPQLSWCPSWEERGKIGARMTPTLWPPTPDVARKLHLDRCLRLWPQDSDTGGFFLALLRKKRKAKTTISQTGDKHLEQPSW